MRNFMPFRGEMPAFSFSGIHTACICGDNGNGKSALIDAITWSLWGKSRTKSDDDLITLGEKDMEVEFDFRIQEQPYRIIRKHSLPKSSKVSGQSSLDLFISNKGSLTTITSDTKGQTQLNIISLLNMDYDTFINSAFLRQGHADEFTKQTPAKRKEVLANILGLSLYDQLETVARDKYRQYQMIKTQLENTIKEIELEVSRKPDLETEFESVQTELIQLDTDLKKKQSTLNYLRHQKDSLDNKNQQMAQLDEQINKMEDYHERWSKRIEQRQKSINDYQELIAHRSSIENGYSHFIQARNLNEELNQKLQQLSKIKDRINRLEHVFQKAQSELRSKHAVAQSRINQLESNLKRLSILREDEVKLENEQHLLVQLEEQLHSKKQQGNELHSIFQELEYNQQHLVHEIMGVEEKLEFLDTQNNARCPLCETDIGNDGLEFIKRKYNSEKDKKTIAYHSQETEFTEKSTELKEIENQIKDLENKLIRDRASVQVKAKVINKSIREADEVTKQLNEERILFADLENRLLNKDFAVHEQAILNELEKELTYIGYDSAQHQKVGQDLAILEKYQQSKQKLNEALKMLELEQGELSNAMEAAQEISHRLSVDTQKRQHLISELKALPQLKYDLKQAETEYELVLEEQYRIQEQKGNLEGNLGHIARQEIKQQENNNQLKQILKEARVYLDLSHAFGKKGIQAMLIEMALPDIEIEANKLLSRMTDNRMHAKIETQRQSKKGDPIETLDIVISDELGSRPYENYSGGEAFRIDFALRIALSRLLAKRAGAPIPTLIIDEGFGTQDNIGLEKVKEAINSVKYDFDMILVITHIEELKDAFPTRINILKTTTGSSVEVN